jgi:hypothetical protein
MPDQRFRVFKRGTTERTVILRMTKAEHAEIEAIADEADIGVSTVCKQLIRQALSRGVVVVEEEQEEEEPQQVPVSEPDPIT